MPTWNGVCGLVCLSLSLPPCLPAYRSLRVHQHASLQGKWWHTCRHLALIHLLCGAQEGFLAVWIQVSVVGWNHRFENNFGFSKSPRDLESNSCGPTPLTVANKTQRLGTTKIETFSSLQDQKMWGEKGAVEDGGMTISGAITAMQTHGACMEKDWPFTLEHVNKKPTDECFADASKYKVRKCAKIVALQPSLVGFCVGVR